MEPGSKALTLDAYQQCASRTVNAALRDDERLLDAACGLAEEAGEVLGPVRKHVMQGRSLDRAAMAEELGDALWCLAAVAGSLGLSLSEIGERNLAKLAARHPDGFVSPRTD